MRSTGSRGRPARRSCCGAEPAPSDAPPTSRRHGDEPSRPSSVRRGRGWTLRTGVDGRAWATALTRDPGRGGSATSPTCSSSPKPSAATRSTGIAVDEGAVRAGEVLHVPGAAAEGQHGVLGRRERVVDDDRVVDVAAERRDGVERERGPERGLGPGRGEHDQPPELAPGPCSPRADRASGRARPRTGSRTGGRGTGSG